MTSLDFVLGLALGLAGSGAAFLVVWLGLRVHRRRLATGPVPGVPSTEALPNGTHREATSLGVPPAAPPPLPTPLLDTTTPGAALPVGDGPGRAAEPERIDHVGISTEAEGPDEDDEPSVQLSQRVLVHLYRQGVLQTDEVAPRALSQAGMIEALHIRQGTLAGVLQRLEAAGVVSAETAHVRGGPRRVKVYRLTDRGFQLARELQSVRAARARRTGRESAGASRSGVAPARRARGDSNP